MNTQEAATAIECSANVRLADGRIGHVLGKDWKDDTRLHVAVEGEKTFVSVAIADTELAPDVSRKVKLHYLACNLETFRDEWQFHELDYDPSKFETKEEAAKALHAVLSKLCDEQGLNSKIELRITDPETTAKDGYGRCWRVCWESGPYQWAVGLSMQLRGKWGYTEPYYSFDLCFTD